MRDVGILIWVVFLVIGVVGSMVSSARRQLAAGKEPNPTPVPPQWKPQGPQGASPQQTSSPQQLLVQALQARVQVPAPSPRPASRPVQPRPVQPRPAPVPRSEPPAAPAAHRARGRSPFGSGSELVRAVIAAEVLGKPRGLNDEYR
jgi:hypothetical protein